VGDLGMSDDYELENEVATLLLSAELTISVAESCSGGLLGHRITSVAGSSEYFLGGVIAYSNEVKSNLLGIGRDILRKEGAVSDTVAKEMALAVRGRFRSDIGVGITGIAGPAGGSEEKPVGLVYVGLADGKRCRVCRFDIRDKTRTEVKTISTDGALEMIKEFLIKQGEDDE
jgi:PncC family amidohydrolase